jgi:hypothetical protein
MAKWRGTSRHHVAPVLWRGRIIHDSKHVVQGRFAIPFRCRNNLPSFFYDVSFALVLGACGTSRSFTKTAARHGFSPLFR